MKMIIIINIIQKFKYLSILIMILVIDIKMSAHKREPLIPEFRKSN
jgi:hypothetical protein